MSATPPSDFVGSLTPIEPLDEGSRLDIPAADIESPGDSGANLVGVELCIFVEIHVAAFLE